MKQTEIINNQAYMLRVDVKYMEDLQLYAVTFYETHADNSPPPSKKTFFLDQEQYMRLKVLAL